MARSPLTDPVTPLNVQPTGLSGFGDPVFSDEFTTGFHADKWLPWYPETERWNATVPGGHLTNTNEPQAYDPSAISYVDGKMRLTMTHPETPLVEGLPLVSGMICSYESFNISHGAFEARIKVADVAGSFPAFWMLPMGPEWPPEIDWMEHWGPGLQFQAKTTHTYWAPGGGHTSVEHSFVNDQGTGVGEEFHTFGGIWSPGRLRYMVDGEVVWDYQDPSITSDPMYLILNLAGNRENWQAAIDSAPFSIDVDYVRAWALDGSEVPPEPSVSKRFMLRDGALVPLYANTRVGGVVTPLY